MALPWVVGYPIRFAYGNYVSLVGTTISATNEVSSLPFSNIANHIPRKVGRSSSVTPGTTFEITITQPPTSDVDTDIVAMIGYSGLTGCTVSVVSYLDSGFSTPLSTTALTNTSDIPIMVAEHSGGNRFHKIKIMPHPNTTVIEVGHLFIGPYQDFESPDFATKMRVVDPSVRVRSYDGSTAVFQKTQYREVEFNLGAMDENHRTVLENIFEEIGNREAFYLFLDPTNKRDSSNPTIGHDGFHRLTMLGFLSTPLGFSHMRHEWHRADTFKFEESI